MQVQSGSENATDGLEKFRADLRRKIFCIGLEKTGTTSFHHAMEFLGLESLHWGGQTVRDAVWRAHEQGLPVLSLIGRDFQAYSNVDFIAQKFEIVDRQYPGSKFVYTTRSIEDWLGSRRRHVRNNQLLREIGKYDGTLLEIDEAKWRRRYDDHRRRVLEYFKGRDDFLELAIDAENKWGQICKFLGAATPSAPFPHSNKGGAPRRS